MEEKDIPVEESNEGFYILPIDYNIRRKVIWKGKMAPKGYVYLVVDLKANKGKYTSIEVVPGGMGEKAEKEIANLLRHRIKDKFKV